MRDECQVLVVGAGPTGLTLACELARRGVAVRIIDQGLGPSTASKGLALWGRTLEVLDGLSLAGRALEQCVPFVANNYYSEGRRIAHVAYGAVDGSRFGQPISLPQPRVEQLLLDKLGELGVGVEWRVRLSGLRRDGDRTRITLAGPLGEAEFESNYVVGCDGAHSSVRRLLGIDFPGRTYGPPILLADGLLEGDLNTGELYVFMAPSGACVVVPMPDGLSRVYVSAVRGSASERAIPTLEAIQQLIDRHGPGGLTMHEPRWMSAFRTQSRQAATWRRGRVLLAGDAAHIHSPAGGQGMNLGIRDAHNLGWKLAAVLAGASPERMLDSYERERRGVAARVIRETDQQMRALALSSRPLRAARDAAFGAMDRRGMMAHQLPVMAGLRDTYRRSQLNMSGSPRPSARDGAPRAGQRLPDVELTDARTGAPVPVLTLLRDTRFVLFVRAGDEAVDRSTPTLGELVHARFGAQVAVHVVVHDNPCSSPPWASSVLVDREASLIPPAADFGALLLRPDGHIAAIARAPEDRMLEYLATTLGPDSYGLQVAPSDRFQPRSPSNQRRTT